MGLTRPIPKEIRDKFSQDIFYTRCCIADSECKGHIQWHHNFTYAGKRTDDEEGILPACVYHHSKASVSAIKERFDWVMLSRGLGVLNEKYTKAGLSQRYKYLENVLHSN